MVYNETKPDRHLTPPGYLTADPRRQHSFCRAPDTSGTRQKTIADSPAKMDFLQATLLYTQETLLYIFPYSIP